MDGKGGRERKEFIKKKQADGSIYDERIHEKEISNRNSFEEKNMQRRNKRNLRLEN